MNEPVLQLFNTSGVSLPIREEALRHTLNRIEQREAVQFALLEVVYVDEEEIVRINQAHLGRDYITDIITFRYDERENNREIEGTLFCCAPRIYEQAEVFDSETNEEFHRIFIHGLLHLIGYDDQTPEGKREMTALEEKYLSPA
ncbi:MAG: rRNA maturation RNase YbeY [Balneolaceae bacterium]